MSSTLDEQIEQLKHTIADMESQRGSLGDALVDATLAPLKHRLDELSTLLDGCGELHPSEPAQQRKLVTLLFMDIAGSTSIAQHMDPEDVAEVFDIALKKLAMPVEVYGGRVTRFMGDGFLSVFGAPIAREDNPEQAVRAGLQIIELSRDLASDLREEWNIPDFQVRVGINTGLVLLGGKTEAEDTLMGAAVNLAARLESAARPGELLISHSTYRHISGMFEVQPLEPISAKGFDQPVAIYRVLSSRPRSFRLHTRGVEGVETRMIGRHDELNYLKDALLVAIEKNEGRMVTITGDAGVGKSRLLYEFEDWIGLLPHPPIHVLEGRARQEAQGLPYALLRALFASCFRIQDNDSADTAREKIMSGFTEIFGSDSVGEMRTHILGQLLGYDFSSSLHLKSVLSDPEQLRDRGQMYLCEYFIGHSIQAPVAILLEDIHWADDSSLDALNRLGELVHDQRLLIVCAARHTLLERKPHWCEDLSFHHRIDLQPLSHQESHELVMEILKRAKHIPVELRNLVVKGAEGNPFYVEELIKILVEEGIVVKGEDTWYIQPERLFEIEVPPTLVEVLQARLDSLPSRERVVLQQASVVGRLFWDRVLTYFQTAGGSSPQIIPETLTSLCARELIYQRERSAFADACEYLFKHDMLREVTYETVLKRLRKTYHKLVAEWLIEHSHERIGEFVGLIALHLEAARQIEQAILYLSQAGDLAAKQYANEEAIDHYQRALGLVAGITSRDTIKDEFIAHILESLGDIYRSIGQYAQAGEVFQDAFKLVQSEDRLWCARIKRKQGYVWQDQGKHELSSQAFAEAEAILGKLSTASAPEWWQEWVQIQLDHLSGYYALARTDKITELVDKLQPVVEQYGTLYQHADFISGQARMYFRRDRYAVSDELLANNRKLLSIALEIGDQQRIAAAHFELGFTLLWHGDYDEAKDELKMALRLAEQCSNLYHQTLCLTYLTIYSRLTGRVEEAQKYISQSTQVASKRQMFNYLATARANQAWVAWREGNLSDVEINGNAALDLWQQYEYFHYPFQWTALWPLLASAVAQDQYDKAVEYVQALLKPDQQRLPDEITTTLYNVLNEFRKDQHGQANRELKKALALAQEIGHL